MRTKKTTVGQIKKMIREALVESSKKRVVKESSADDFGSYEAETIADGLGKILEMLPSLIDLTLDDQMRADLSQADALMTGVLNDIRDNYLGDEDEY